MSNGMKRGWLCAAAFVALGLCAVVISMAAAGPAHARTSGADNSPSVACTARSNDPPSISKAPDTDDLAAYRRRRWRRRMV
jgi:hypothetical protein